MTEVAHTHCLCCNMHLLVSVHGRGRQSLTLACSHLLFFTDSSLSPGPGPVCMHIYCTCAGCMGTGCPLLHLLRCCVVGVHAELILLTPVAAASVTTSESSSVLHSVQVVCCGLLALLLVLPAHVSSALAVHTLAACCGCCAAAPLPQSVRGASSKSVTSLCLHSASA